MQIQGMNPSVRFGRVNAPRFGWDRENEKVVQKPEDLIFSLNGRYGINKNPHVSSMDTLLMERQTYTSYEAALERAKDAFEEMKKTYPDLFPPDDKDPGQATAQDKQDRWERLL